MALTLWWTGCWLDVITSAEEIEVFGAELIAPTLGALVALDLKLGGTALEPATLALGEPTPNAESLIMS